MHRTTKRVTFTLYDDDIKAIERISERTQRSRSQVLRILIQKEATAKVPAIQEVKA